ncbi:HigA family addiction module antitoxin [Wenyingzhuangia aestuarii]|uniref:HigA family addiction module antitoxin n=1 Tax=Wenyingzhuangia aestuarii TaxID=1647582 RepID=UPI001438DEDC|nr:HigA family addiction module antitoxin [Wenyingzhuangia aestuarii]NJB82050.1 HTH-type transcriptional regulator/antitoxin HigA [Wenyingzhuangia aestuarii]
MHPGVKLQDLIKMNGISQKDLSKEIGVAPSLLNGILKGDRNITTSIAISLEAIGFKKAKYWLDLQLKYSLANELKKKDVVKKKEKLEEWTKVSKLVPFSFFKQDDTLDIVNSDDISKIYEIYKVKNYNELADVISSYKLSHFRKSLKLTSEHNNLVAWSLLAEYKAEKQNVPSFDKNTLSKVVNELKDVFYKNKKTISSTKKILNKYGIKFLVLDRPTKTHADGKSFVSSCGNPVIVMSLKYKRLDNFAFTLLHELFHVYHHLYSEKYYSKELSDSEIDLMELEADRYSRNALIPYDLWMDFIYGNDSFNDDIIYEFSDIYRIHPGIIRGRVCHENPEYYRKRSTITKINVLDES